MAFSNSSTFVNVFCRQSQSSGSTSSHFFLRQSELRLASPLVQISASSDLSRHTHLLFFPLRHHCGETFITFHMSPLLHLFLDVGPTTRQPLPLSAFWALYLPSPLLFGSRKATCHIYISPPSAIRISPSPSILFYPSFLYGISASTTVYILLVHCHQ